MKKIFVRISGYLIIILFSFSAIFAESGIGVNPDEGLHWVTVTANIVSNFIPFFNFIIIVLALLLILTTYLNFDGMIKDFVDNNVKKNGVIKTANSMKTKKWILLFVTLPYWSLIIAAGWVTTVIIWAFFTIVIHILNFLRGQYLKEEYINKIATKDE